MFGRKGQGAMEYLMTYGWAILVVMIVGIVMWQLGIFNLGGTTLTSTGFAKIKPQLSGTGMTSTGQPRAVFTNGVGTGITLATGKIKDLTYGSSCTLVPTMFVPQTISAGENFKISSGAPTTCLKAGKPGDVYNAQVTLAYDVSIGTISTRHSESGTLRGPME